MKAPLRIVLVAVLCVAALIAMVVRENMARAAGTEVLLAMEALDPRALLSGHYVIVNLRENLDEGETCPAGLAGQGEFWAGEEARLDTWAALAPAEGAHRIVAVAPSRGEALGAGPTAARGRAFCGAVERFTEQDGEAPAPPQLYIQADLGVRRFYASQSNARRIETALVDQRGEAEAARVFAIVSIGQDGRARMSGVKIGEERFDLELN